MLTQKIVLLQCLDKGDAGIVVIRKDGAPCPGMVASGV